MIGLYKKIITDTYEDTVNEGKGDLALYKRQLNDYSAKVAKARDLLLRGDLESSDYRDIKHDCERQISIIEGKLVELSGKSSGIGPLLDKALKNMAKLPEIYQNADSQGQKENH